MSDPVLLQIQKSMPIWRQQLWTADDINFERSFHLQVLKEMHDVFHSKGMEDARSQYVNPPSWLPDRARQFLKDQGVGTPRLSSLYRMEYQTHLHWFDVMAEIQRTNSFRIPVDFEDQTMFPGLHWHIHFQPRWRKWLSIRYDMWNKLLAMEAILAAERYRVKHHQMPSQWNQLVPQYYKKSLRVKANLSS